MPAQRELATYRLDLDRQQLQADGGAVALAPKVLRLLACLVENAGRVVGHEELLGEVWSGVRVSGDAVRYAVRELRKGLGDRPRDPGFIETVPRKGWRFVGRALPTGPRSWLLAPRGAEGSSPGVTSRAGLAVGRSREHLALREALARARAGDRQLVMVTGEPGIGKTTLIEEFLTRVEPGDDLAVGRGQSVEHHGPSEAYLPLLEALERLSARAGAGAVGTLRRYAPMWLAALPALTEPDERAALQRELEGATQQRMVRELASALEMLSRQDTLVLWLDDLHWSDTSTLDCLAFLMSRPEPARLLVLGAYRPAEATPAVGALHREVERRSRGRELPLGFLAADEVESYVAGRFALGPDQGARELAAFLYRCTEGNPLFVVSVIDDLVARGHLLEDAGGWRVAAPLESADVPATVGHLLERELHRASAEERALLEVAAVAGLEFSAATVAAGTGRPVEETEAACQALALRRSFLVPRGSTEWPDGTVASQYGFVHGLHRDVLSARLTGARRARLHRAIGTRLERAFDGPRLGEIAAELAVHFEQGRDLERAIRFRSLAGERAAHRFANVEAADHLRGALALLDSLPESPERNQLEIPLRLNLNVPLAATGGYASAELAENLERFRALTGPVDDWPPILPILLGLWSLNIVRADLETASSICHRVLRIAESEGDATTHLQAHRALAHTLFYRGELDASLHHLDRALEGYDVGRHERVDYAVGDDPVVLALSYYTWSLWFRGRPEQAVERSRQALAVGERLAHPPSLVFARFYTAMLHHLRRDERRALAAADDAFALADREGLSFWAALSTLLRGWALVELGDPAGGLAAVDEGYRAWEQTGGRVGRPYFLCCVAEARAKAGRLDDALALLPEIDAEIAATGQSVFEPERHRLEGELLRRSDPAGGAERAAACLARGLALAEQRDALGLALRAALSLANLELETGVAPDAAAKLAAVRSRFREGFGEPDLQRADAVLARLAQGRAPVR